MTAQILLDGTLVLEPQSSTEYYALAKWYKESKIKIADFIRQEDCYIRGSRIKIRMEE